MRKQLMLAAVLASGLCSTVADGQVLQNPRNPNGPQPPAGSRFLPRQTGGVPGAAYQNSAFGNNNANFFQGANSSNAYNPWGPFGGYSNPWSTPFASPWQGSPYAASPWAGGFGYGNPWQGNFGYGNMYAPAAPFGGYQTLGYGNFAPIVGVNNGWWPYQPAYDPNNPVTQYLNNLYLQGLPSLNSLPR